ncbi:MAG: glycosyltransferase family 39 protein [Patescibacteria group bacterium]
MNKLNNSVSKFFSSKAIETSVLVVIIVLGFLIRTWHINFPIADWHSWRQADTASVSRIYLDQGVNVLAPRYYDISRIQTGMLNPQGLRMVEFPIYNLIHVFFEKNFHLTSLPHVAFDKNLFKQKTNPFVFKSIEADSFVVWARLVTIFSAIITAFFLYLIGKKTISKWGGVMAAFFYLFMPYNIYFTRVVLPEPIGVAFLVSSLYFFIRFTENDKAWPIVLSGVLFALATLIKPFVFFYSLPLLYLAFSKFGVKCIYQQTKLFIFATLAIVPFFVWRIWVNNFPEGIPHFDWAFNGDGIRFRPAFWNWIFAERIGKLILGMWGLILFGVGIVTTKKNNWFNLYFFLGSVLYVSVVATASVRHDYYQILIIPSICLLLAQGVVYLWTNTSLNKILVRSVVVFSVFMMLLVGYYQTRGNYQINHPEIIVAGAAVQKLTPKEAIVIAPYNGDTAFLYATNRFGYPVIDDSIENMIKKGAQYYVSVNFDNDTNALMKKYKTLEKTEKYVVVDLSKKGE